jgi:hypothetical protein
MVHRYTINHKTIQVMPEAMNSSVAKSWSTSRARCKETHYSSLQTFRIYIVQTKTHQAYKLEEKMLTKAINSVGFILF